MDEVPEIVWLVFAAYAFMSTVDSLRDPPPKRFTGWKLNVWRYVYRPFGVVLAFVFAAVLWSFSTQLAARYLP